MIPLVQVVFSVLGTSAMARSEGRRTLFYLGCIAQSEIGRVRYRFNVTTDTIPYGGAAVYSQDFHGALSEAAAAVATKENEGSCPDTERVNMLTALAGDLILHDYLELLAWFTVLHNDHDAVDILRLLEGSDRLLASYQALRTQRPDRTTIYALLHDELLKVRTHLSSPVVA